MKKTVNKKLSYVFVILGAACWGLIGVFNRTLGDLGVSVFDRVAIRAFPALVLMTLVFALFRPQVFHVKLRHLPFFAASGLFSVLTLSVAYFYCQMECSLALAATLMYLAPTLVVLMSALLWRAPLTKRKLIALGVALVGCALVSGIAGGELSASPRGLLLGLLSALCYATYTVFAHYTMQHYDSYTVIYWTFVFCGIGSLFLMDPATVLTPFSTVGGTLAALGLSVIACALPYLFYTKGLEGVESGRAAILANVEPVVAALVGLILYHETPDVWMLVGIVCVLGSAALLAKEE